MRFIMYISLFTILLSILIWAGIVVFLQFKKKKDFTFVLFFTLFYIYIVKVLDFTLFQLQSLILIRYFVPNLILRGESAGKTLNLIPLITLSSKDVQTSLLNILLMTPFGFGLPFITDFGMKRVVISGILFSVTIELLQLVTGLLANISFRVTDINDVIFNTIGTAIGYILFIGFLRVFRQKFESQDISKHTILKYIIKRPQVEKL